MYMIVLEVYALFKQSQDKMNGIYGFWNVQFLFIETKMDTDKSITAYARECIMKLKLVG